MGPVSRVAFRVAFLRSTQGFLSHSHSSGEKQCDKDQGQHKGTVRGSERASSMWFSTTAALFWAPEWVYSEQGGRYWLSSIDRSLVWHNKGMFTPGFLTLSITLILVIAYQSPLWVDLLALIIVIAVIPPPCPTQMLPAAPCGLAPFTNMFILMCPCTVGTSMEHLCPHKVPCRLRLSSEALLWPAPCSSNVGGWTGVHWKHWSFVGGDFTTRSPGGLQIQY